MKYFFLRHFNLVVTGAAMVLLLLFDALAAPVPGLVQVLLTLLALACIFAARLAVQTCLPDIGTPDVAVVVHNLHSALDFAHDGIAVLDSGFRVVYTNKEFRRMFSVAEAAAKAVPDFADIIRHGLSCGVYDIGADDAESFCARRLAAVASSNPQPATLHLANHVTIRFSCSILPDGGRMLTYSNITDLADDVERLEVLAHIDSMTGLINRRRFFDIAGREWAMALRYGREIAVLMLDIDHFKNVNDTLGHAAGDEVIRHIAAICTDSKRATDVVARLGGEEFALLLPETDISGAMILAERIRIRVAANPLVLDGQAVAVTISIGVAERRTDSGGFEALLARSDRMLYAAKRAGRNRVLRDTPGAAGGDSPPLAGAA